MFPNINIYSAPLLILVIQGLIFGALLLNKGVSQRKVAHFFLAILVLITCYHRTTYTIGFMGWYDTFRNTKVNYYLIPLVLAVGPLIYFYIKSSVQKGFEFNKQILIHFIPVFLYVVFKLVVVFYDSAQPGYEEVQNGPMYLWVIDHLTVPITFIFFVHLFLYLLFSFKLYYAFRKGLNQEYSNTYQYELRWLRNFLFVYSFLFAYDVIQSLTDSFIFQLHWTQEWWYQFFSLLIVIYVGVMGNFAKTEHLVQLDLDEPVSQRLSLKEGEQKAIKLTEDLEKVQSVLLEKKLYLDPNLSLSQLSRKMKINSNQLSQIINSGSGKNFNDFINTFRVDEVKRLLKDEEKTHLSILSIAYDSGFNSKATFNRVFKRLVGQSPSEFRQ